MRQRPSEPTAALDDGDDGAASEPRGDLALLEELYAFMYEDAVLVGPGDSGSPRSTGRSSPLRARSPTRQTSPSKVCGAETLGPTTANVPSEPALSRELMNALLPPKSWRDERGKWQRMVRLTTATRTDVLRLQRVFDDLLDAQQARATAICPVREKLFLLAFEELIRETACECPERGLLLLRVRDELRLTVEAYQTLYHNSIAYGRQKAVQAEAGMVDLEHKRIALEEEQQRLVAQRHELTRRVLVRECLVEAEVAERQRKRELEQAHALQQLRDQQNELETFLRELTQDTTWK
ncbi:hypothetical protein ATCC90586_002159 [Pythium insidiosum]|nr:hypothetical protein ATCC90586_002159 [Pythium insidiosum]